MENDEGFSLTEVLIALVILSLAAPILSTMMKNTIESWDRIAFHAHLIEATAKDLHTIERTESTLIEEEGIPVGPFLNIDDAPPLIISSPRLNQSSECNYDLVGRRCR